MPTIQSRQTFLCYFKQIKTLCKILACMHTCTHWSGPSRLRASAMSTVQSRPTTSAPVLPSRSKSPPLPFAYTVMGTVGCSFFVFWMILSMYGRDHLSHNCKGRPVSEHCRAFPRRMLTKHKKILALYSRQELQRAPSVMGQVVHSLGEEQKRESS